MLTRPLGRPKNRWEDEIRNDKRKLKIKTWTSHIQDRNKWKLYVENEVKYNEGQNTTKFIGKNSGSESL